MGREYKIAFYGTIITMISFILIAIMIQAIGYASRDVLIDHLIIVWPLVQLFHPILGPPPVLSFETIALMALADIYVSSSNASLCLGLGVLGSLTFAIGSIMMGYGFYGFHKQEKSILCLITALVMMIGFGALAVIIPLGLFPTTTISPWTYLIYNYFSVIVPLIQTFTIVGSPRFAIALVLTAIIIVVVYLVLGVTLIVIRERIPKRGLIPAAGIPTVIGAILFLGIIGLVLIFLAHILTNILTVIGAILLLGIIGIVLIFVAYILLALVFNELRK